MPVEMLKLANMGLKGLSTDTQPWELPAEYLTYGANFRVFAGALQSAGGYQKWSASPVDFYPGHIIHVGSTSGDYWIVCGRTAVYVWNGATWTVASSTAGYAALGTDDELLWTSCMLGKIPIINNPQIYPEYWSPQTPGIAMQRLMFDATNTWQAMGYQAKAMRSHRNFLFALNLTEGGVEFPDSYRWSHPADINGLPASWDETDTSFLAGKASLGGDGGQIIDGRSLKNAFCIYSENSIDVLDYSNDEFVWNRRELSSSVGLLARNCLVEIQGTHFFLADGDIVMNDGTNIQSIAHNRIRKQLNARINVDNYQRSFAVRNNSLKEIWFCVVEEDAVYPNIAYIYNYADDSWAIRDLPYTAVNPTASAVQSGIAYAGYGSQIAPVATWDGLANSETWDSGTGTWGSAQNTPLDDTVVGVNPALIADGGGLYLLDPSGASDVDISTRLERTDYALLDNRQVTTITRAFPHMQGTQPVEIQFGSQDFAGSPIRWQPAITFTPGVDRKVDFRTTGELHCYRIDSVGTGNYAISGMDIEFVRNGER
jgi:hypothetical protein